MMYLGGKSRLAKKIAETILSLTNKRDVYLEPCLGGGATFTALAPHFSKKRAGDVHPDLVMMWQAVASGWAPPENLTREDYYRLKNEESSALRGFAGFGCSFSGKWWGGYAKPNATGTNYVAASRRSVIKTGAAMVGAEIVRTTYGDWNVDSTHVVYADPPYRGTTSYQSIIDHDHFWTTMGVWVNKGAHVFVSEYVAPEGWDVVASWPLSVRTEGFGEKEKRTEKLFHKREI